ncbi:hypothetical protein FEM48_Zijuj12G0160400 [Ziziphus jujuba var. spinosa]|uniref:MADS-box domain-containing protein n=1 Tax=Ziziphus jujuba var. spinosa TaxID=714518 RepID=A0A978UEA5_ZIZJJ|nr:hypothetical protein FEM48_Zijuj12G0160400 [Ziziphus jujuba var. spinosa]
MGKGKRKLPMELIGKKENRMVSFSKRRKGLIKKAEEFHSLTGSSIALIVISEAGRPSVYGAPSFDSVLHRFQLQHNNNNNNNNNNDGGILSPAHSNSHTTPTPETLFIGGSNQEDENLVVVADQQPWPPETLDLPHDHHRHSFEAPPSELLLIPQGGGSTTAPSVPVAEDDNCLFDIDTLLLLLDGKAEDNAAVNGTDPYHTPDDYENAVVVADQEPSPTAFALPHDHYCFYASPTDQVVHRGSKENNAAFPIFN